MPRDLVYLEIEGHCINALSNYILSVREVLFMEKREFKVVYNSDLIIRDRSELASLCVFYDKVLLPSRGHSDAVIPGVGNLNYENVNINNWELENCALFDQGVLSRLRPVDSKNAVAGYEFRKIPTTSEARTELVIYLRPENIPADAYIVDEQGPAGAGLQMSW